MSAEPHAVWSGSFRVLGVEMRCHVLNTGQRVIDEASMRAFTEALMNGGPVVDDNEREDAARFAQWMRGRD